MINHIRIKNFKALKKISIDIGKINVFTGLNGMGKSTILQAFQIIRFSKSTLPMELKIESFGTYEELFCEASNEDIFQIQIKWDDDKIFDAKSNYDSSKYDQKVIDLNENDFESVKDKCLFQEDKVKYLSAERIGPRDYYNTNKTIIANNQFGDQGEFAVHYFHENKNKDIPLQSLAFGLEDKVFSLEEQLNKWLSVISPKIQVKTKINNNLVELFYEYATKGPNTSPYRAKNAGFGLTYVFSVLVAILSAKKGDILIIENPESHIHPKGQSELARLLALAAESGVQIFLETHSDHIIYGLRVAVKEKLLNKNHIKLFYFDRDEMDHFSKVEEIKISNQGHLDNKSEGYFNEFENHLDRLLS
ncbi:AAA family ATPase [Echinicola shivajiensis]|uniref:AAA family ATPase n=1 Tax=Echinicola shivajiensis TaxID=1035916 RepID=UPI0021D42502|nr:DUF3696 domain-containing protein [Echinicola shivajiensis]